MQPEAFVTGKKWRSSRAPEFNTTSSLFAFLRSFDRFAAADSRFAAGRLLCPIVSGKSLYRKLWPGPDAPFVLQHSYFGRERFESVEERNGLQMHFAGWSQPLENYMPAPKGAGLVVSALGEPIPDASEA